MWRFNGDFCRSFVGLVSTKSHAIFHRLGFCDKNDKIFAGEIYLTSRNKIAKTQSQTKDLCEKIPKIKN